MTELFPDAPPMFLERMPFSYHDRSVIAIEGSARLLADRFGGTDLEGRNTALVATAVNA
jgi:hypothetical protein